MKGIVYHIEARFDILEIVEFYERESGAALADQFTAELESFVERIAQNPSAYREFQSGARRVNLHRFPHHILYRILEDETVKIISVKHDRRRPSYECKALLAEYVGRPALSLRSFALLRCYWRNRYVKR